MIWDIDLYISYKHINEQVNHKYQMFLYGILIG